MTPANFFISYRSQEPDFGLAQRFYRALSEKGHEVFMAAERMRIGDDWPERIDQELEKCDFFLLLLSERSSESDMVTEEVKRAKELRDQRKGLRPRILPVRVKFPPGATLNYDLRSYLSRIHYRDWDSEADTEKILEEVLMLVEGKSDFGQAECKQEEPPPAENFTRPVPVAEPELPEGQVAITSLFYVERPPVEQRCYREILRPGGLVHIKGPRQMGKTSLMARILYHARTQGRPEPSPAPPGAPRPESPDVAMALTLQIVHASVCKDLRKLLQWFCMKVAAKLRVSQKVGDHWSDEWDDKENGTGYMADHLLTAVKGSLTIGLDEADRLFESPGVAEEFFGLLRGWHEMAKDDELWQKLRIVLAHSTESYVKLDVNQSPFNVGYGVRLGDLPVERVKELAQRHRLAWGDGENGELMRMVGGHPHLVRVALYTLASDGIALGKFLREAPTEGGPYRDHLLRLYWIVMEQPNLADAMRELVCGGDTARLKPEHGFKLESLGLAKRCAPGDDCHGSGGDEFVVSYDLYRKYFRSRLGCK